MACKNKNFLAKLNKIPTLLAENFSFSFFVFISCAIFLANLVFYKYYILNHYIEPAIEQEQNIDNEKNYNDLIKIWEEQDKKIQGLESKNYVNFFKAR